MKRCTSCDTEKSRAWFHRRAASKDGLSPICKPCAIAKQSARYRKEHPLEGRKCDDCGASIAHRRRSVRICEVCANARARTQKAAYAEKHPRAWRKYYDDNKAKVIARAKECRASKPGYKPRSRMSEEARRVTRREHRRRWAKANPDKVRENNRRIHEADPSKARARAYAWRKRNPDKAKLVAKMSKHRRRAVYKGSSFAELEWLTILETFGQRCAYCLQPSPDMQMDHVIPIARGGAHEASNVVPACRACNQRKNSRSLLRIARINGLGSHGRTAQI